jgi:hypothetical protein
VIIICLCSKYLTYEKPYHRSGRCPVPGVSGRITGTNLSTGKTVVFYQVLPVTREEIDYKDEHGSSELIGHIFGDDNVLETIINRLKIQ